MTGTGRPPVMVFSESAPLRLELLAAGRQVADATGVGLIAVAGGSDARVLAPDLIARGAEEVLVAGPETPEAAGPEASLELVHRAVLLRQPGVLLVGATRDGSQVAARLGQRLDVPCASDCLALRIEAEELIVERRVYGGRFLAEESLSTAPRIATIPRARFEPLPRDAGRRGAVREIAVGPSPARVRVIATTERQRSARDIADCDVIVTAGRGVRKPEDLALLEGLAAALGGVVGASRPLTDDLKWLPADRKIGLSGRTVRPRLCVLCGVSGQIEHVVGMRGARTVVALNSDPRAPIHDEADFSLVGDLYDLVPALTRAWLDRL